MPANEEPNDVEHKYVPGIQFCLPTNDGDCAGEKRDVSEGMPLVAVTTAVLDSASNSIVACVLGERPILSCSVIRRRGLLVCSS